MDTTARSLPGDPLMEEFAARWLCDNPQSRKRRDLAMRRTYRAILTHRETLWWLF
ncbi:MAG: Sec7 domain-containing protein [Planctomycetaceae bacterium]|nr:Sec7 domain-containing protein [Planctomycetaceae bacterium]